MADAQTRAIQPGSPVMKPKLLDTGVQVGTVTYHGASSPLRLQVQLQVPHKLLQMSSQCLWEQSGVRFPPSGM